MPNGESTTGLTWGEGSPPARKKISGEFTKIQFFAPTKKGNGKGNTVATLESAVSDLMDGLWSALDELAKFASVNTGDQSPDRPVSRKNYQ